MNEKKEEENNKMADGLNIQSKQKSQKMMKKKLNFLYPINVKANNINRLQIFC